MGIEVNQDVTGRGAGLPVPKPELFIPVPPPPRNLLLLLGSKVYTVTPDTERGGRASTEHISCPFIDHTLNLVVRTKTQLHMRM